MTSRKVEIKITANNAQALAALRDTARGLDGVKINSVRSLDAARRAAMGSNDAFAQLRNQVVGLASIGGGIALAKGIIAQADAAQQLQGRLKLVTGSAAELAQVNDSLFASSQRTGTEFAVNASSYARLASVSKELGLSQTELLRINEAVSASVIISGASTAEAASSMQQFAQALGSGTLAGDELKSILENNISLAQAVARGLGVTVGELKKLGKEGRLTSKAVAQAVLSQADEFEAAINGLPRAVGRAATELKNEYQKIIGSSDLSPVVDGIDELKRAISDPAIQQGIATLVGGIIKLTSLAARAAAGFGSFGTNIGFAIADATGQVSETVRLQKEIKDLEKTLSLDEGLERRLFAPSNSAALSNQQLRDAIKSRRALLDNLTGMYSDVNASLSDAQILYAQILGKFNAATNALDKTALGDALGAAKANMDRLAAAAGVLNPVLAATGDEAGKTKPQIEGLGKATKSATQSVIEQTAVMQRQIDLIADGVSADEAATRAQKEADGVRSGALETYLATENRLKAISTAGADAATQLADMQGKLDAIAELKAQFDPAADVLARFNAGLATLSAFGPPAEADIRAFAEALGNDLVGSVDQGDAALTKYRQTIIGLQALKLSPEMFDALSQRALAQLDAVRDGAESTGEAIGESLTGGFEGLRDVLAEVSSSFGKASLQIVNGFEKIGKADKKNADGSKKSASQIHASYFSAYGQIASGASVFFNSQSKGYKTLQSVSKAYHAAELALTLAEMVPKGITAVLNQAGGDPYTAFARMAAMAAVVGALGVAIGGGGSGGSGGKSAKAAGLGQGTTLGDSKAGSESLTAGVDKLESLQSDGLKINNAMLQELRQINEGINGFAVEIFKFRELTGAKIKGFTLPSFTIDGLDKLTAEIVKGPGGRMGDGPVLTRNRVTANTSGDANTDAQAANDFLRFFADSIHGVTDALRTAAPVLGTSTAALDKLFSSLEFGAIDIRGLKKLNGDELTERLSNIVGAQGDKIVAAIDSSLGLGVAQFQKVGEGLLQTLIRVSSQVTALDGLFDDLGIAFSGTFAQLAAASEALAVASGGFDKLTENLSTFYDAFYSDAEKAANIQQRLTADLAELGLALPATRAGFRAMVEGVDAIADPTKAAALYGLAKAADSFYDSISEAAAAASDAAIKALDAAQKQERAAQTAGAAVRAAEDGMRARVELGQITQDEYLKTIGSFDFINAALGRFRKNLFKDLLAVRDIQASIESLGHFSGVGLDPLPKDKTSPEYFNGMDQRLRSNAFKGFDFERPGAVFDNFQDKIGAFRKKLEPFVDYLHNVRIQLPDLNVKHVNQIIARDIDAVKALSEAYGLQIDPAKDLNAQISAITAAEGAMAASRTRVSVLSFIGDQFKAMERRAKDLTKSFEEANPQIAAASDAIGGLRSLAYGFDKAIEVGTNTGLGGRKELVNAGVVSGLAKETADFLYERTQSGASKNVQAITGLGRDSADGVSKLLAGIKAGDAVSLRDSFAGLSTAFNQGTINADQFSALLKEGEKAFDGLIDTVRAFGGALSNALQGIANYRLSLETSAAAQVLPEAARNALLTQFDIASTAAKGGDLKAIDSIQGLANQLLDASKGVYATGSGFQNDLTLVKDTLDSIIGDNNGIPLLSDVSQQQLGALRSVDSKLAAILDALKSGNTTQSQTTAAIKNLHATTRSGFGQSVDAQKENTSVNREGVSRKRLAEAGA